MLNVSELFKVPELSPVPFSRRRRRERIERSREKINEVRASNRQEGLFGLAELITICSNTNSLETETWQLQEMINSARIV